MPFSAELLKAAHKHVSRNRQSIEQSANCGCFYCLKTFPANTVKEYTCPEDALCPHCGIDSVLADASGLPLDESFLAAMHQMWFGYDVEAQ